jgi:glycosyltransferase involved in cell wall biosynthesis
MFSYYFPPHYSGSAQQAINLAKKLRKRGVNVTFCTVGNGTLPARDVVNNFEVYWIDEGNGRFGEIVFWKNMFSLLWKKKNAVDVIHSHGAYLRNSFVGPLARILGKKSIAKVTLANNDLHGLGRGRSGWLHKFFISRVDKHVSISREITAELKALGFPEEKICEIPNGVDSDRFHPASYEEKVLLRKQHGFPEDALMVLYVGVVDERKNVKVLVEMWNKLYCEYPGFLVVTGPVSREDKGMKLYKKLQAYESTLKGKLFFMNYVDAIEDYYKMADIFVLPSANEGMPNVILEAMSSGLPCIVSRVSGAEDLINGENGLFFEIEKTETLLYALNELRSKSLRIELGEKARKKILENFTLDKIAEKYIDVYEEMLNT